MAALPFTAAGSWLKRLPAAGVTTVTLSAPRGMLNDLSGGLVEGRLYGTNPPPQMMAAVADTCRHGLTVIAGAGVWSHSAAQALCRGCIRGRLTVFFGEVELAGKND